MQIQGNIVIRQIGEGGFAKVFYAETIKEKEPRALKCISLEILKQDPIKIIYLKGEIDALKKLDSPNIIKLKSQYISDKYVCLFTEYCNKGDLRKYIQEQPQKHLNEPETINIMIDILTGLGTMHRNEYIHRDLKPDNIFLNEENGNVVAKIGDLGFTKKLKLNQLTNTCLGTDGYMAPEIIQKQPYNSKVDVWSLGCIVFEMLYGTFPFQMNWGVETVQSYYIGQKLQIEQLIRDNKYITREKNNMVSSDIKQLLINMLSIQPQDRFGFDDIYKHTLFIKNKQIEQLKNKNEAYYLCESQIYKEQIQEKQNNQMNYNELIKKLQEKIGKGNMTTQQSINFDQTVGDLCIGQIDKQTGYRTSYIIQQQQYHNNKDIDQNQEQQNNKYKKSYSDKYEQHCGYYPPKDFQNSSNQNINQQTQDQQNQIQNEEQKQVNYLDSQFFKSQQNELFAFTQSEYHLNYDISPYLYTIKKTEYLHNTTKKCEELDPDNQYQLNLLNFYHSKLSYILIQEELDDLNNNQNTHKMDLFNQFIKSDQVGQLKKILEDIIQKNKEQIQFIMRNNLIPKHYLELIKIETPINTDKISFKTFLRLYRYFTQHLINDLAKQFNHYKNELNKNKCLQISRFSCRIWTCHFINKIFMPKYYSKILKSYIDQLPDNIAQDQLKMYQFDIEQFSNWVDNESRNSQNMEISKNISDQF